MYLARGTREKKTLSRETKGSNLRVRTREKSKNDAILKEQHRDYHSRPTSMTSVRPARSRIPARVRQVLDSCPCESLLVGANAGERDRSLVDHPIWLGRADRWGDELLPMSTIRVQSARGAVSLQLRREDGNRVGSVHIPVVGRRNVKYLDAWYYHVI